MIQDNAEVIGPQGVVLRSMEFFDGDLVSHSDECVGDGSNAGAGCQRGMG